MADDEPLPEPAEQETARVILQMSIDLRSTSLAIIALLVSVYMLHWASAVFIPLLLGLMLSYAL